MVDDLTASVESASPWAGVGAFPFVAGSIGGTLGVDDTLWSAVGRGARVVRRAGADCLPVGGSTQAIRAARRGLARLNRSSLSHS